MTTFASMLTLVAVALVPANENADAGGGPSVDSLSPSLNVIVSVAPVTSISAVSATGASVRLSVRLSILECASEKAATASAPCHVVVAQAGSRASIGGPCSGPTLIEVTGERWVGRRQRERPRRHRRARHRDH